MSRAAVDFDRLAHWRILPVLTEDEVGALTGLSRSTIQRLRASGELEVVAVPSVARVLYRTASVARLLGEAPKAALPRADGQTQRDADLLLSRKAG